MKVFDCFKFFNEFELVELRFMVLNDFVDYFVIVEANKTHTGKPKSFIFEQNTSRFIDYLDKIIYVKVTDLPDYSRDDIWKAENFQRNCITRGLDNKAEKGDKIIISDADEIPNPDILRKFIHRLEPVTMIQHLFYYYVNCLQQSPWRGSIMGTYGYYKSPQELRDLARHSNSYAVSNGGWHYSFMGGAERIRTKVENIAESHLIIDKIGSVEEIHNKMIFQKDLWNRTESYAQKQLVDIRDAGLSPICIWEFIKKYPIFYFSGA